jgi:hypothetical protein
MYITSVKEPEKDHKTFDLLLFVHHIIIMVRDEPDPVTPSNAGSIGFFFTSFFWPIAHLD